MSKIVAIVVTYNRKKLLRENIEALLNQSFSQLDIMIIDNASTDGTYEYISDLAKNYGKVKYYNTGKNLGGAGGFSLGIKKACEKGYEKIWIMDDDTIPQTTALEELVKADKLLNGDYGFLASTVLWTDNSWNKMNLLRTDPWHVFEQNNLIEKGIVPINRASFVSLLINAKAVFEMGLPIKEFFIWSDDQEYTDRLSKKYPCYYVSHSKVIHKTATNEGSNIALDTLDRIDRYKLAFRNEYYIARRNKTKKEYNNNFRGYFLLILRKSPNKKIKRIKTLIKGKMAGKCFKPEIEYISNKES